MTRPSRARRILKRTGAVLSIVAIAAWGTVSLGYTIHIPLGRTGFVLLHSDAFGAQGPRGGFIEIGTFDDGYSDGHQFWVNRDKWARRSIEFGWPQYEHCWFGTTNDEGDELDESLWTEELVEIAIPFWLLLLLIAIPTVWLWHRDRRLFSCSPDHLLCSRCGYDLTGNTSGVCSECGLRASVRSYR